MPGNYPLIPIISFLSGALALVPLPRLLAHRNTGAVMYALWVSLGCFIHGINEIIWKDNMDNVAPVWCDISVRFYVAKSVAIPAASLVMTRRIYLIFSLRSPMGGSRAEMMRALLVDLGLTLGLPILEMVVYLFVQPRRYIIREEYGCETPLLNAWPSFLLVYTWPLGLGLTSCVFCARIMRTYLERRKDLIELDSPSDFGRYYRALALGCVDVIFTVPCSALVLITNSLRTSIEPYSWSNLRINFSSVYYYPSEAWRTDGTLPVFSFYWNVLASPICAFIFFCFFGLTWEVWEHYAKLFGFNLCTKKMDKQLEPPVDLSDFGTAANQRRTRGGSVAAIIDSIASTESTISTRGLQDATLSSTDYRIPPLKMDVMQPLDISLTILEQV